MRVDHPGSDRRADPCRGSPFTQQFPATLVAVIRPAGLPSGTRWSSSSSRPGLDAADAAELETAVLERASRLTVSKFRRAVRTARERRHPETIANGVEEAFEERTCGWIRLRRHGISVGVSRAGGGAGDLLPAHVVWRGPPSGGRLRALSSSCGRTPSSTCCSIDPRACRAGSPASVRRSSRRFPLSPSPARATNPEHARGDGPDRRRKPREGSPRRRRPCIGC